MQDAKGLGHVLSLCANPRRNRTIVYGFTNHQAPLILSVVAALNYGDTKLNSRIRYCVPIIPVHKKILTLSPGHFICSLSPNTRYLLPAPKNNLYIG